MKKHITQKELHRFFDYDNGYLVSKVKRNTSNIGDSIGVISGRDRNYLRARINGRTYYVHRMIFLYCHGYLPKYIDHIDNNSLNNQIENLRSCTQSENSCNSKLPKNNTSGFKGVTWDSSVNKWKAFIILNYKEIRFGYYKDKEKAAEVVAKGRLKYHGKFANNGQASVEVHT